MFVEGRKKGRNDGREGGREGVGGIREGCIRFNQMDIGHHRSRNPL